jgi:glutathionylspermidine synthase
MKRHVIVARKDWAKKVEALGFDFHTSGGVDPYWDESVAWEFSSAEIDEIEEAANAMHRMCMMVVEKVIENRLYARLGIPDKAIPAIEASWAQTKKGTLADVLGRFDFAWNGGSDLPKVLEYNANTPTSLPEASIIQWCWNEDRNPGRDQFNSIHEHLMVRWQTLRGMRPGLLSGEPVHFGVWKGNSEDEANVLYHMGVALQAECAVKMIGVQEIGWDGTRFVDVEGVEIRNLFLLYPWEWIVREDFGTHMLNLVKSGQLAVIEPAWKMILSNKALMALLWEMFPHHPNLLETHFSPAAFPVGTKIVAKPFLGREGANVATGTVHADGSFRPETLTEGPYSDGGYVYQAYKPLRCETDPKGVKNHAVLGVWTIGGVACGMGIRESDTEITNNTSRFVPHYF